MLSSFSLIILVVFVFLAIQAGLLVVQAVLVSQTSEHTSRVFVCSRMIS